MIKLKRGMIKLKDSADSPGIGMMVGASRRVVGDADPYGGDAVRQTELVGAGVLDSPLGDDLCADGRFVKRPYGVCFRPAVVSPHPLLTRSPFPRWGKAFFCLLAFCTDLLYNESISTVSGGRV